MSTVAEITAAIEKLPAAEQQRLREFPGIPTGFHPPARRCGAAATPGQRPTNLTTLKGLNH